MGKKDNIYFEIVDNGKGMTPEETEAILARETDGYGIRNVNDRIKLKFGEQYGIKVESVKGEGTTVTIIIPKVEKFETTDDYTGDTVISGE